MPEPVTVRRSAHLTRQRILEAAVRRFSRHSYEATRLRDIAADVGVDVALVHRSFGSKEELFRQALQAGLAGCLHEALAAGDPGAALTGHVLRGRRGAEDGTDAPFDIVTHSLSSDSASPILRDLLQHHVIQPLAERLEGAGECRAALAVACLTGVAILADVLGVPALRTAAAEDLAPMIEQVMRACLGDRDAAPPA